MSSLLVVKAARSRGPKVGTRGRSSLRPDSGLQPRAAILVTSGHGESPSGPERGVLVPSRPGPRTLASRRARGRKCCDEIFSMVTTIYYCSFVFPPTSNFNHPKIFDPNVCLGWGVNREICRKIPLLLIPDKIKSQKSKNGKMANVDYSFPHLYRLTVKIKTLLYYTIKRCKESQKSATKILPNNL